MLVVAFLGFVLILQAGFIAGQVYDLPGGGKIVYVRPFQDSSPRPEHRRERKPPGYQVIQLGDDNGPNMNGPNNYNDSNSVLLDGIWDYLKHPNGTGKPGPSGFQVIRLGGDNGPKKSSHSNDDDSMRNIFKIFRFGSRRGDDSQSSNVQVVNLNGRDLGNRQHFAQDRSDYDYPSAGDGSEALFPRTRVKVVRQNVPRRMLVRNLRSSQAHLTNMQTLSFPVFEDEWQIA